MPRYQATMDAKDVWVTQTYEVNANSKEEALKLFNSHDEKCEFIDEQVDVGSSHEITLDEVDEIEEQPTTAADKGGDDDVLNS